MCDREYESPVVIIQLAYRRGISFVGQEEELQLAGARRGLVVKARTRPPLRFSSGFRVFSFEMNHDAIT